MIFVTVGSTRVPFDRLVGAVDLIADQRRVLVQRGASGITPKLAEWVEFLSFDDLSNHMVEAETVIAHAGVGSIIMALTHGKRPIVVPRRQEFGEAVDDHQLPFARRLAEAGLVTLVEDPADLGLALDQSHTTAPAPHRNDGNLARDLRAYVAEQVNGTASLAHKASE